MPGSSCTSSSSAAISSSGSDLSHLRELERDEVQERHLGSERLRRGDAHLDAGPRIEHRVHLAGDLRAHHVRDRERVGARLPRETHRRERVRRLARLRDPDHERVLREHGVPVAPLARDVVLDGDAGPFLDRVPRDDARVVRGAAGDDDDAPEVPDLLVVEAEPVELEPPVPDAVADRLLDRVRLLVDLLQHEGLEPALLRGFLVPVDLLDGPLDRRPVGRREGRALGVTATISSSSMNCTLLVSRRKAVAIEARNISPFPTPTSSGHWWRAPTSSPGARGGRRRRRSGPRARGRRRGQPRRDRPRSGARRGARSPRRPSRTRNDGPPLRATPSARGSSRRSRSGSGSPRRPRNPSAGVRSPRRRARAWPSACAPRPSSRRMSPTPPRPSETGDCRLHGCTRIRRPSAARGPQSRSRGTRAARGHREGATYTGEARRIR